jgi:8-oxo-dGTP pyrophosphatase MutT (NUDIX family)
MYEVFLNDRKIVIASENDASFQDSKTLKISHSNLSLFDQQISGFLNGNDNLLVLTGNIDFLWKNFQQSFRPLRAAGGVVYHENSYLFIFRKGKWDLPKGKQDTGETPEMTAIREVREETGLHDIVIDGVYPTTWHIYQSSYKSFKRKWILKETAWFSMRASGSEVLIPQTEEDIEIVRWFSKNGLDTVLNNTYASLKNIIWSL